MVSLHLQSKNTKGNNLGGADEVGWCWAQSGSCLSYYVFHRNEGIMFDSHIIRIITGLGFGKKPKNKNNPESLRQECESWMEREIWPFLNERFASLGQLLEDRKDEVQQLVTTGKDTGELNPCVFRLGCKLLALY